MHEVLSTLTVSSLFFIFSPSVSQLPTVDPKTGIRDAAVPYKVLMKFRTGIDPANMNKPCFGVNGVPEGCGVVRVGDLIKVLELVPPDG